MEQIFSRTLQIMKQMLGAQAQVAWDGVSSLDIHEVPMCLRAEGLPAEIVETAYYESLRFFVENEDQGNGRCHPSGIRVNPSLQWLQINQAAKILDKKPGLYLLWKTPQGLREMVITERQAELLDQLMDDQIASFSSDDEVELQKFATLGIVK